MTPGCTTEACDFRDHNEQFEELNAVILGISPDPAARHEKFIEKHGLPFLLLADENHEAAESFDVWQLKRTSARSIWALNVQLSSLIRLEMLSKNGVK